MNIKLIAEISANHLGKFQTAKDLISEAKNAGANYVKLQTYKAETMTLNVENNDFKISPDHKLWGGRSLYELYQEAHTPWEWHEALFRFAQEIGIKIFSTPFDISAVDFLEKLKTPLYKIASMETGDIPLIRYIAKTQKPIIASTGASTLEEIDDLVEAVFSEGNKNLTLLLCTSAYPTPLEQVNLLKIDELKNRYNVKVGLSDHTLGNVASLAAVSRGATVIERHFIMDRNQGGPDSAFSLEPKELKELADQIKLLESCLGTGQWKIQADEKESRRLRRSLIITADVKKGEIISVDNIKSLRPSIGLEPKYLFEILGKRFTKDLHKGDPLLWDYID
jgi:pseudaminic acid synthase